MVTEPRTERVEFRFTTSEVARLRELAEADGISSSDVVRMLIRRTHAERFGAPAAQPSPRRVPRGKGK